MMPATLQQESATYREIIDRETVRDLAGPLAGVTNGRLVVTGGVSHLTLQADAMPDLIRAHFEKPRPRVRVVGGDVTITYPRPPLLAWLANWRDGPAQVALAASIPWHIAMRGGVSKTICRLTDLPLTGFAIDGGVSDVELSLGRPRDTVPVRIEGGAANLTIRRPVGVPVRLRIAGGVTRLSFDTTQIGAAGGANQWESPDFAGATERYEITVGGGASRLSVLSPES